MKNLEKRQEKLQKIVDELRVSALEPAQKEAQQVLADAKQQANDILNGAKKEAEEILQKAQLDIKQERSVFESSLTQASKQSIESLRQAIEKKLFSDELEALVKKTTSDKDVIAKLINAIIVALEKQGLDTDLSVIVPKSVTVDEINGLLAKNMLQKLKNQSVQIGDQDGGVFVKLKDQHLTLDMSDKPLKDLLANYVRKDFRKYLFGSV